MKRTPKPRSKRPLSPERLQRREAIFALYRDMGPGRTRGRLIELIRPDYGPVSPRTLVNWSREHHWRVQIDEYDRDRATASQAALEQDSDSGDQHDQLLSSAALALRNVMRSNPLVRTAHDAKMLVDAAEKAIKLADMLKARRLDSSNQETSYEWSIKAIKDLQEWVYLAHAAAGRAGLKIVKGELVPDDAATGMANRSISPAE